MITCNELIENYVECNYKSFFKLNGISGSKSNLEKLESSIAQERKYQYVKSLKQQFNIPRDISNFNLQDVIKEGKAYLFNVEIIFGECNLRCDLMKKVSTQSLD